MKIYYVTIFSKRIDISFNICYNICLCKIKYIYIYIYISSILQTTQISHLKYSIICCSGKNIYAIMTVKLL